MSTQILVCNRGDQSLWTDESSSKITLFAEVPNPENPMDKGDNLVFVLSSHMDMTDTVSVIQRMVQSCSYAFGETEFRAALHKAIDEVLIGNT